MSEFQCSSARRFWHIKALLTAAALSPFAGQAASPDKPMPWPVSVAKDGFSPGEVDSLLAAFAPGKLAIAGNQALYSYLNMAQFFPQQLVARGGKIRLLTVQTQPKIGDVQVETELGRASLSEMLEHPQSRVQGFLVLHKGKVVYEAYPGMRPDDTHLWWSVAKVLTGTLVELLIDDGKIERDKAIVDYLPSFKGTAWDGASVDHVLDMASGIDAADSSQAYANPESGIGRLIYAEGILVRADGAPSSGHDDALRQIPSQRKPGEMYEYSSANTNMLGLLIEAVTGQQYADVVQERIWKHIGAEGDAMMGMTPDGRPIAHGMFSSRLRDLARFGQLYTASGHQDSVLPQRVLDRIQDASNNVYFQNAPDWAQWAKGKVGAASVNARSQWDAIFADGDLFKSGFDGQALYVSPKRDVVVAMFSTSKSQAPYKYLRPIALLFD